MSSKAPETKKRAAGEKKPKAAKTASKAAAPKMTMQQKLHGLFESAPKSFLIGQDIRPKMDVTHFVRWPKYVRLQRQKRILLDRMKCPPPVNMFNHSLDKATAVSLFKLMHKMRPEEKKALRKQRMEDGKKIASMLEKTEAHVAAASEKRGKEISEKIAARKPLAESASAEEKKKYEQEGRKLAKQLKAIGTEVDRAKRHAHKALRLQIASKRAPVLRYGLNNVANLVEKNKAQLVVLAHDVDPIELVLWLPALCRKKHVAFCVVKGKARLGKLVHRKTATCVAITSVPKEDREEFGKLVEAIKPQFLENSSLLRAWGENKFGLKHRQKEAAFKARLVKDQGKKQQRAYV